jgi:hypothetical protein
VNSQIVFEPSAIVPIDLAVDWGPAVPSPQVATKPSPDIVVLLPLFTGSHVVPTNGAVVIVVVVEVEVEVDVLLVEVVEVVVVVVVGNI